MRQSTKTDLEVVTLNKIINTECDPVVVNYGRKDEPAQLRFVRLESFLRFCSEEKKFWHDMCSPRLGYSIDRSSDYKSIPIISFIFSVRDAFDDIIRELPESCAENEKDYDEQFARAHTVAERISKFYESSGLTLSNLPASELIRAAHRYGGPAGAAAQIGFMTVNAEWDVIEESQRISIYQMAQLARCAVFSFSEHLDIAIPDMAEAAHREIGRVRNACNEAQDSINESLHKVSVMVEIFDEKGSTALRQLREDRESAKHEWKSIENELRVAVETDEAVNFWRQRQTRALMFAVSLALSLVALLFFGGHYIYNVASTDTTATIELIGELADSGAKYSSAPLYVKSFAAIGLLVAVFFALARTIGRLMMTQFHIAEDAGEKRTLLRMYRAMEVSGSITDNERQVIIQRLARPTATGLIRGDTVSPVNLFSGDAQTKQS